MNPKIYEFDATLYAVDGVDGAYIEFPYDLREEFGKLRVPVTAYFDGEPYKGSLVYYGRPHPVLGVRKEIRNKIGKRPGDRVRVRLQQRDPRAGEAGSSQ